MEWVKVVYPHKRDVFVDGRRSGESGVVLTVARGTHRFELGLPPDYRPTRRDVKVVDTAPLDPLEIHFAPSGTAPA